MDSGLRMPADQPNLLQVSLRIILTVSYYSYHYAHIGLLACFPQKRILDAELWLWVLADLSGLLNGWSP